MSVATGTRLGPYEVLAPLGAGGMGEVYRARDERLKREVAIKVLPASFSADADRLRRFEQEAQAAGALNHPNILAIYDVGTHEGSPYVVSELLEGEKLRARLAGGAFTPRKALGHALQIASGLAAAHEKGIVHRDLKPENIFVTKRHPQEQGSRGEGPRIGRQSRASSRDPRILPVELRLELGGRRG
jgi:serine/threonine protein kinase